MSGVELSGRVAEFVRDYEWRGESDYTPTDQERCLIEDAIHGFLAEHAGAGIQNGQGPVRAETPDRNSREAKQ